MGSNEFDLVGTVRDAYVYAYALVLEHLTMRQATNVAEPHQPFGPWNRIAHARELPGPEFRVVIRPNVDTLYSSGFVDLGDGPWVLSMPATDRYVMLPIYDLWTNVFAVPGTRTTGTDRERHWVLAGPTWRGEVPDGLDLIRAPTRHISFIGRTQVDGPDDVAAVHSVQDGMSLVPLDAFGDPNWVAPVGKVDVDLDMTTPPPDQVEAMGAAEFFGLFTGLWGDNPPAPLDYPIVHRMARIGLTVGRTFDLDAASDPVRAAFDEGAALGRADVRAEYDRLTGGGDGAWTATEEGGAYGVNYLLRAGVAAWGLGMNLPEDAVYPSVATDDSGAPLHGEHRYRLRFEPGGLPPADAFWSVTAYDDSGFLIANEISRYAVSDRGGIALAPDGSFEVVIQADRPVGEAYDRWLPVARAPFNLMLRLYSPSRGAGEWTAPAVLRRDI